MIKGTEKEQKSGGSFKKYVGMFNATVVAVNPTTSELEKLLNTTIEKDQEYTGVNSENGAKKVTLSFWLKEVTSGHLFNVRFNLEDTVVESSTGKTQFINNIGTTSYAQDESSIPSFLTEDGRTVRKAKKGEELLYKFLRAWLNDLNYKDSSTELMLDDWKGLLSGKTKELKDIIARYDTKTVCAMATVRMSSDGKEYQGVYSYEFLPGYCIQSFTGGKEYTPVARFKTKIEDGQYGCKDFYVLKPLMEYDPAANIVSNTNQPVLTPMAANAEKEVIDDLPF